MSNKKNKRDSSKRFPTTSPVDRTNILERTANNSAIRFLPEKRIGIGALCEVHAAKDLLRLEYDDGCPNIAVKRLLAKYEKNPIARRLLAREFFITRNISYPGVVRVFDLHKENNNLYLSMELLAGQNLYDILGRNPSGLGMAAVPLARQLFKTMALLHGLGIIHGDIKPSNLILEKANRLVLLDFNTAEVIPKPGHATSHISQSLRSNLGIPAYSMLHASPERLQGHPLTFADDVFAACCTIIELMEGIHPFSRRTALEAKNSASELPRLIIGKTPKGKMLLRGLSFNPASRPSARDLEEAFRPQTFANRYFSAICATLMPKES